MRQRNRTSSSSAHSANAALNAKITNSLVLGTGFFVEDKVPEMAVYGNG